VGEIPGTGKTADRDWKKSLAAPQRAVVHLEVDVSPWMSFTLFGTRILK